MIRSFKTAALAAAAVLAFPAMAAAQQAVATTDLNMRAGPGPEHQVIGVIPANQGVAIHECTASMNWCQVSFGNQTAWAYSPYLTQAGEGTVAFAGPPPAGHHAQAHAPTPAYAGEPAPEDVPGVPPRQRGVGGLGAHAGIAGGALAGGLIGGPPGAIIGGATGALATAGPLSTPTPY